MIDTTIRPMDSRESAQHYDNYRKSKQHQIELAKKKEFEDSLRESSNAVKQSNSALYGANKSIFEQDLTKDSAKLISLNKRKHKMKEEMIDMITDLNEKDFDKFESTMMTYQLTK